MSLATEISKLNRERSRAFCQPAAHDARALYASQHPTHVLVFKCMDGRIHLPLITGIPLGILHPFRNIGGKFTLGYPYLGRLVLDAKETAVRAGQSTLALCTYHFSKGSTHRGCAGHNYDTEAARRGAFALKREFETIFGADNPAIRAIVIGIETDENAIIFCGEHERDDVSVASFATATDDQLLRALAKLYATLPAAMLADIAPIATGNREHVRRNHTQDRPIAELVHGENIICVGRGFDWLHLPNRALIIGPYGDAERTWRDAVQVAGSVVLDNFKHQRVPRQSGTLLLVSAPYSDLNERGLALAKAGYFSTVSRDILAPVAKQLRLETLVGITDMMTMHFEPIKEK
ncbi:MAG: hypothetical protein WAT84_00610 [Candidatus Moraniibacteriota bacterium]